MGSSTSLCEEMVVVSNEVGEWSGAFDFRRGDWKIPVRGHGFYEWLSFPIRLRCIETGKERPGG